MIITIHQPQYLPWLGYFDKARQSDIFILLDNVQFKKNEWQNRNRIRTPQGWQWLTVPVLHDFGTDINAIMINNKISWREDHQKAIQLNYCKAPYFNEYYPFFQKAWDQEWEKLSEINIYFVRLIAELLGIKTRIVLSSEYEAVDHKTMRLVDLCRYFNADTYLSGEGGMAYLDEGQFKSHGIKVSVQQYRHPQYPQRWMNKDSEGFISHLSVIDLLFNCGPESLGVLSNMEKNSIKDHG
jgi:hypothetical protein